uniref:SGNH hydrolase-type esterase domain-containing protein n=1 Tax=Mucochytrium quahogii TaxID=96639 RepID=A0A7S2S089_9STRA|mmetsp:Transcript_10505/g.19661  ORF Transcript_10505/g.19661 Transcript_10505/m.19661 type:complete len:644 (+) Transcript_10505:218-2149(+)
MPNMRLVILLVFIGAMGGSFSILVFSRFYGASFLAPSQFLQKTEPSSNPVEINSTLSNSAPAHSSNPVEINSTLSNSAPAHSSNPVETNSTLSPIWPETLPDQGWSSCAAVKRKASLKLVSWLDEPFVPTPKILKTWSAASFDQKKTSYSLLEDKGLANRVREFGAATNLSDVLRFGDKELFAKFGEKLLTKKQTTSVFIGGSNTDGRTRRGFVDLFRQLLDALYPPKTGRHKTINHGIGGATSCKHAEEFKMDYESQVKNADLVVIECFLNDQPGDRECIESLILRIRRAAPCALIIDLALSPRGTMELQRDMGKDTQRVHDRIIKAHSPIISGIRIAPLALDGRASTIPENPTIRKEYMKKKFFKDKVHLGDYGVMYTALALGAMTIEAQRVAQHYTSHVTQVNPQPLLTKPVPDFDMSRRISSFSHHKTVSGYTIPLSPSLYEICNPKGSSSSCSREVFNIWNLWKSNIPCKDCGHDKAKGLFVKPERSVQQTDGGWVLCTAPWKNMCRRPAFQFDYCAKERSGLLHLTLPVKQREVHPINMIRVSLSAIGSYENFGEAQVVAWVSPRKPSTVPSQFASVYMDSLWKLNISIPTKITLQPPLLFPPGEKIAELNLVVMPGNWANRTRCKLQILKVQVEYR